jgi:hypothetical protein
VDGLRALCVAAWEAPGCDADSDQRASVELVELLPRIGW